VHISPKPYIFSDAQTQTLKNVGVNLDQVNTESEISLEYEIHLNAQKNQKFFGTALVISQLAAIIFSINNYTIASGLMCLSSIVFSYIYYKNNVEIALNMKVVKNLGGAYSEVFGVSARDGMALAIEAHARRKITEARQSIKEFRQKNPETNYVELNETLSRLK